MTRRVWPITTLIVLLAYGLAAYQLLVAFATVILEFTFALFAGLSDDKLVFDDYISTSMACLTTLPAFAAMIWCGWQRGARLGLWAISVPAAVMPVVAFELLNTPTFTSEAGEPRRALELADLFVDTTLVNWKAVLLFGGFATATHLLRRRARHTQKASAA